MTARRTFGALALALALGGPMSPLALGRTSVRTSPRGAASDPRPDDAGDADPGDDNGLRNDTRFDARLDGDESADDEPRAGASDRVRAAVQNGEATYRIRSGDTLWNVSQSVGRDTRGWAKLWALNPAIANPHWIYPGQVVRLRDDKDAPDDSDDDDADPEAAPARPAPRETAIARRLGRPMGRGLNDVTPLRQLGFVDEGALQAAGTVTGSVEEKIMLATGDQAYVELPVKNPARPGTRYSIYEIDREHPLRSPDSAKVLGYLVHVHGEIVIDESPDRGVASGHLVNLAGPVERGCRVGPVIPQMRAVAPRPNKVQVTARVVASVDPSSLIGNQMFVILDRGKHQGVEPGNRFLVLRQGDGLRRVMESWDASDPRFPPYAAAEIVAIDVGNETTIGWISRGSRELRVGDIADLRRGY